MIAEPGTSFRRRFDDVSTSPRGDPRALTLAAATVCAPNDVDVLVGWLPLRPPLAKLAGRLGRGAAFPFTIPHQEPAAGDPAGS